VSEHEAKEEGGLIAHRLEGRRLVIIIFRMNAGVEGVFRRSFSDAF
jgi:hypothetical protein